MVLSEGLFEEGVELVVVLGVERVAAHAGVGVHEAGGAAGDQAHLLALVQTVEVGLVERLRHAVVRVLGLDLQDLRHVLGQFVRAHHDARSFSVGVRGSTAHFLISIIRLVVFFGFV